MKIKISDKYYVNNGIVPVTRKQGIPSTDLGYRLSETVSGIVFCCETNRATIRKTAQSEYLVHPTPTLSF